MKKLGRNDRCHCGSGLKYKRCCLDKDEAASITQTLTPQSISWMDRIDHDFEWPNELHRLITHHFIQNTLNLYEDEHIESLILMWNMYVHEENPITKKLGVFPAALEYMLCQIFEYDATQKEIADKYNISVSTLSQRANQLYDYSHSLSNELLNSGPPSVSLNSSIGNAGSRIIVEQEMAKIHALLEGQDLDSIEDVNAFLEQNMNNPPSKKASKEEQATELVYQAWTTPDTKRMMKLAQDALSLDPNCIDAYNIFAVCSSTPKEQAYYYKQGMLVGEKHWGEDFFEENKGYFWGYLPTRP